MQSTTSRRPSQDRLLTAALCWLVAGVSFYILFLPATDDFSPAPWLPPSLIQGSLQPMAGPFLTLAITVALLLASIWVLNCSRDGAFLICAAWATMAVVLVLGNQSGFWGQFDPMMPGLAAMMGSLHESLSGLGGGTINADNVTIAAAGSGVACMVVLNCIPPGA